ncbi:TWiK family of potassium channels protein 7-like [Acanthaster planci]|uniref:TWiK family of potassium channels protein 7-like n=1 Tax=Acanthaster planci TaxID=133434 RepID=A0A8B7YGZ8_ACAPL|nr:TWiK family of potassium channels protein 7-like [Acanthaster planci]
MADRGRGETVDSALSYSVLENDADIYTGPSDEYGPSRRVKYSGRSSDRASGRLSRGLRAAAPHVVLVTVYLVFLLFGGGFFYLLEGKLGVALDVSEEVEYSEYEWMKTKIEMTLEHEKLTEKGTNATGNWSALWGAFNEFVEKRFGFDPKVGHKVQNELSFGRSVLFCATTMATIGYGDSVPNNTGGKVLVVCLSLVGIPLTLLVYADIGKLLARGLASLVDKWRNRGGGAPKRHTDSDPAEPQAPAILVLIILVLYFLLAAMVIALIEGWYYPDALYFTFITFTTIGFGDIVPVSHYDHVPSFVILLLFFLLGFSLVAMSIVLLLPKVMALIHQVAEKAGF